MRIADAKLGALRDAFLVRQTLRDLDERGALLDADHATDEPFAPGQGSRDDAGAATEVKDLRGRSKTHPCEVGVPIGDELRVPATELQTLDEPLQRRLILLVHELHRVASGHRASPRRHRF